MAAKKPTGKNRYWAFLMSERAARPELSQVELEVHCSRLWRHGGFDSYGRPLDRLLTREAQHQAEADRMQLEIKDWVEEACRAGELSKKEFYIIHTNVFCLTEEKGVVPAEVCVARVTLAGGVQVVLREFIAHGDLPLGYRADCVANADKTHKIPLNLECANSDHRGLLARLADLLGPGLPPLYTLPRARRQAGLVLAWLQERAGPGPALRLYSLPCLLFQLARVGGEVTGGTQVPTVSLAEVQLDRDWFLYTPGMACAWHQQRDETEHCSEALVRRWSYILLHICCPRLQLPLLPGRHRPSGSRDSGSSVTSRSDRSREAVRVPRARPAPAAPAAPWLPPAWGAGPAALPELPSLPEEHSGHPFLSISSRCLSLSETRESIRALPPHVLAAADQHASLPPDPEEDWEWEGLSLWSGLADTTADRSLAR